MTKIKVDKLLLVKITTLGLVALMLLGPSSSISAAPEPLSEEQKRIYKKQITDFDIKRAQQVCAGGATNLSGRNEEEKIYRFLVGKKLTAQQAAGVVGNFAVESGFDPFKQEIGKTPPIGGYGIAQWTGTGRPGDPAGGRRLNLIKAMQAAGLKVDLNTQTVDKSVDKDKLLAAELDYLWKEATERGDIEKLKKETTVKGAVISWLVNFEVAGIPHTAEREKAGEDAMLRYGSTAGSGSSQNSGSVACETEADGEIVGEYSLPVAKKYFDSNPEWFTKPHHDYPAADIPVGSGNKIFSVASGTVTDVSNSGGDGRGVHVQVTADNGVVYKYFHGTPGSVKVRLNSKVQASSVLMLSDNTGQSSGPHLHFQIEVGGQKRCPQKLLESIGKGSPIDVKSLPGSGCTY